MTPLAEIPINSLAWIFGLVACLALAVRSWIVYRHSFCQLTKYICWFALLISISLAFFGLPSLFTLNEQTLHTTYIIGELFMYAAFVPQAAILWSLVLRRYLSMYAVAIPVGVIGVVTWLYSAANSSVFLRGNFIDYNMPWITGFSMAILFLVLFVPPGLHFMHATTRQNGLKDRSVTFVLGMVYAGIGVSTAAHLVVVGHAVSPASSVVNLVFFIFLFTALAWPRQARAKSVLPQVRQTA